MHYSYDYLNERKSIIKKDSFKSWIDLIALIKFVFWIEDNFVTIIKKEYLNLSVVSINVSFLIPILHLIG